jgi:hypothetical protein
MTVVYPGTFKQALSRMDIRSGDTLFLAGGTYTDDFTALLTGVTIKPVPGERAIVNGKFLSNGSALRFEGIEFTYLDWISRESAESGSDPSDIPNKDTDIHTPSCEFINCVFHDLPNLGLWTGATAAEFYGCIIYHNGWTGLDRGHGHSLYTQNNAGTTKTIKHNIMFDNFGWGIHAYGSNATGLQDFDIIENTCFDAGILDVPTRNILIGAESGEANNIRLIGNLTHNAAYGLTFYRDGAVNVTLEDNYCPDGKIGTYTAVSESGNYWGAAIGNEVFLYPNAYDLNRANLTIYNEAAANTVDVDVSAIFGASGTVKAYNVQDYFVDIQTLTITAGVITVNMQAANRTVATPIEWTAPAKTFPTFGCFVLVKQ